MPQLFEPWEEKGSTPAGAERGDFSSGTLWRGETEALWMICWLQIN